MKPYQLQVLLMGGWKTVMRYADADRAVLACNRVVTKGRVSARIMEDDENNIVYEKYFNSDEYESEPLEWQKIEF